MLTNGIWQDRSGAGAPTAGKPPHNKNPILRHRIHRFDSGPRRSSTCNRQIRPSGSGNRPVTINQVTLCRSRQRLKVERDHPAYGKQQPYKLRDGTETGRCICNAKKKEDRMEDHARPPPGRSGFMMLISHDFEY